MRITVITPVYNGEKFIAETVKSVLDNGEEFGIEYIIIDDGSTDSTSEILKNFMPRVKVITQPNSGESAAVNRGLSEAIGDFILIVSADDPLFTSDLFKGVPEFFDQNLDVVAWYPNWRIIDAKGKVLKEVEVKDFSDELLVGKFICLPGPGTFFRKISALSIGGRNTKWKFVGDYDFWLRISRKGNLRKRSEMVAQWRLHENSTSISKRGKYMFAERVNVINDFLEINTFEKKLTRMAKASALYSASLLSFYSDEISGRTNLFKAIIIGRGYVPNFNIFQFSYICLLPFSRVLKPVAERILRRSN